MTEVFVTTDGYIDVRGKQRDRARLTLHTDELVHVDDKEIEELFYDLNNPYWVLGDKDDHSNPRKHFTVITMDTPIHEHLLNRLITRYDFMSIEPGINKLLRYTFSRR